jgi:hypothetical protein
MAVRVQRPIRLVELQPEEEYVQVIGLWQNPVHSCCMTLAVTPGPRNSWQLLMPLVPLTVQLPLVLVEPPSLVDPPLPLPPHAPRTDAKTITANAECSSFMNSPNHSSAFTQSKPIDVTHSPCVPDATQSLLSVRTMTRRRRPLDAGGRLAIVLPRRRGCLQLRDEEFGNFPLATDPPAFLEENSRTLLQARADHCMPFG